MCISAQHSGCIAIRHCKCIPVINASDCLIYIIHLDELLQPNNSLKVITEYTQVLGMKAIQEVVSTAAAIYDAVCTGFICSTILMFIFFKTGSMLMQAVVSKLSCMHKFLTLYVHYYICL